MEHTQLMFCEACGNLDNFRQVLDTHIGPKTSMACDQSTGNNSDNFLTSM